MSEFTWDILLFKNRNPLYTGTPFIFLTSIIYVPATEEGRPPLAHQEVEAI